MKVIKDKKGLNFGKVLYGNISKVKRYKLTFILLPFAMPTHCVRYRANLGVVSDCFTNLQKSTYLGNMKAMAGHPTHYREEYAEQARKICLIGATDEQLADFFEVSVSTINNWKKAHPEFLESIKRGKAIADAEVADRLYQRAKGFEHDAIELKVVSSGMNQGSEVVEVPIRKIYPPDTVAAIFWLKNRQPDTWRDKKEFTGDLTTTLLVQDVDNTDPDDE